MKLVITPGDPFGVGPEVTALAVKQLKQEGLCPTIVIIGDKNAFLKAAQSADLCRDSVQLTVPPDGPEPIEVRSIRMAVDMVSNDPKSALITGPINKKKLSEQGFQHPGHTDFLGELCGVKKPTMAFAGEGLPSVALVTVHLPLAQVADSITTDDVLHTISTAHRGLVEQLGIKNPRIAICGLNPHAGDGGLLGAEEGAQIAPAVQLGLEAGLNLVGPISAETVFTSPRRDEFDLIVAMYHDQGLVPLKAIAFGQTVNWTLGLPIIRVSVDHGTAYDIAWTGAAKPDSMIAAIHFAIKLITRRGSQIWS